MTGRFRILGIGAMVVFYLFFVVGARGVSSSASDVSQIEGAVVLPPALQTILYLGDRNLAANVESSRVLATGGDVQGVRTDYFRRLQLAVDELNPCHEDNYYLANALLAWAGQVDPAITILRHATQCRFWDETPPFLLGYGLYFFRGDRRGAIGYLNVAAERAGENRAGFKKLAIMIEAEGQRDASAARAFLVAQASQARDAKLRTMLNRRIVRLDGLIALRDAQVAYERSSGKTLEDPEELLSSGLMAEFPTDPLGLGYEFRDGRFELREVKIALPESNSK